MEAKVLNGKELSTKIKEELKIEVEDLKKNNINPGLAVIMWVMTLHQGYVNSKKKACAEIGIESFEYALEETQPRRS